jgi:hypothetical protein
MKQLKRVLTLNCLLALLVLVGCTSVPKNPEKEAEKQINACVPNAIIMAQALRRQNVWAKVLIVKWEKKIGNINGHAYTIYLYPSGNNLLWAYDDTWGSTRLRAFKDNPMHVGIAATEARNYRGTVVSAQYID